MKERDVEMFNLEKEYVEKVGSEPNIKHEGL